MREITPLQAMYIGALRTKDITVHVLDCNVNVCHLLVINSNEPDILRRVYVNPTGKPVAKFKYRQIQSPVAAAA